MATFQDLSYGELSKWISAGQGGPMAVEERHRRLLSGEATWQSLQAAVKALVAKAPNDHDVLLHVGGLMVTGARFIEPHTFLFEGITQDGHQSGLVCHFTQVVAQVIYLPKRGPSRIITGFAPSN